MCKLSVKDEILFTEKKIQQPVRQAEGKANYMKTDIEIAREAQMLPIREVAAKLGMEEDDLELYGKYKAKVSNEYLKKIEDNPQGKLVLVTAINPTPAGEGKTTVSVGLGQALCKLGKRAVIALREPSLGPCFGIKGGAAGGGYAQVVPMDELNLHFTGDSRLPITCWPHCWTITFSREMNWESIPDR